MTIFIKNDGRPAVTQLLISSSKESQANDKRFTLVTKIN